MFKCDFCKRDSRHGESMVLVPKTEPFVHPVRRNAKGDVIDPGGDGSRIVGEAKCCPRCHAK